MKRTVIFALTTLSLATALTAPWANAQSKPALTGREIMERVEKKNRAADESAEAVMKISEDKTVLKERKLKMSFKSGVSYEDRSLFRFESGDVRGTAFLTHQHGKREDDQWIYLPALKKSKRLAAGEKKESFVGSDYAYEDLRTEVLDAHEYTLTKTEMVKAIEKECHIVEARATGDEEKRSTGYSKRVFWISTDDLLVRRIDYYSGDGEDKGLLKSQYFSSFESPESYKGFSRARKAVMIHAKKKTKTEFSFETRAINGGITDEVFSERELSKS